MLQPTWTVLSRTRSLPTSPGRRLLAEVEEAQEILKALGMPPAQHNPMAGMTLIALCGPTPNAPWSMAERRRCTVAKGIMDYLEKHYGTAYAANTRETFRRQVLHQFVQGGIADYNPFEPDLPTNSPKAHYAVTKAVLDAVRQYRTNHWEPAVARFRRKHGALVERYARNRDRTLIPVRLPGGRKLRLSPGRYNQAQKAIVEEFAPRFAPGSHLLYIGDTTKKDLFADTVRLGELRIPITGRDKLPDVVLYDAKREWLFLVEAVTSHGPVSPSRMIDLEAMLAACPASPVYVSAFPDFDEFRKHMQNIAWETEVWLCDAPDHMIHYDGQRFPAPRPSTSKRRPGK